MSCKLLRKRRALQQWEPPTTDERSSIGSKESQINFGTVEIREYNRVLVGEHANVDISNALALGWDYEQRQAMPLHEFEQLQEEQMERDFRQRCSERSALRYVLSMNPGRVKPTPVCCARRRRLLESFGYTVKELRLAEKKRIQILNGKIPLGERDEEEREASKGRSIRIVQRLLKPLRKKD